jgi:hypothetical protein
MGFLYKDTACDTMAMRWRYDICDTIRVSHTGGDLLRLYSSTDISTDKEDTSVIWQKRVRLKNKVKRRKYWVHDHVNKSGELGSLGAARAIDLDSERIRSFHTGRHPKSFKFFPFLDNRVLSWRTNGVFPDKLQQPRFKASAAMLMRSGLFWDITRRRVVIVYRRFGTTYRSHLQVSRTLDPRRWDR